MRPTGPARMGGWSISTISSTYDLDTACFMGVAHAHDPKLLAVPSPHIAGALRHSRSRPGSVQRFRRRRPRARLYAQQTYQWGYRSIEILTDKVVLHKAPATAIEYSPLLKVDKSNAEEFEQYWKRWLRR